MWDVPIIILRELLGDQASTLYTNSSLQRMLAISAFRVSSEVSFDNNYIIDLTSGSESVSPDFNVGPDKDFINLMCLRAAVTTISAEIKLSTNDITSIKDGPATITLSKTATLKEKFNDTKLQYDEYVKNYLCGKSKYAGACIGPYGKIITNSSDDFRESF